MSFARLKDIRPIYKNQLYFYALATDNPKMKISIPIQNIKKKKILRNQLMKEVPEFYTETFKTLLREIKNGAYRNWTDL